MGAALELGTQKVFPVVPLEVHSLEGLQIREQFVPGQVEPLFAQSVLKRDFEIEGQELAEDVSLNPVASLVKHRPHFQDGFEVPMRPFHLPEPLVQDRDFFGVQCFSQQTGQEHKLTVEPGILFDLGAIDLSGVSS